MLSILGIVLIVLKPRHVHGGNIHVRQTEHVRPSQLRQASRQVSMPTLLNPAATQHNNSSIHSICQLLGYHLVCVTKLSGPQNNDFTFHAQPTVEAIGTHTFHCRL
jgi:hypothetical protein